MNILRPIPTVRLAAIARRLRTELEHRAEHAIRYGVSAPGQWQWCAGSGYYPTPPLLPVAAIAAIAIMCWWALR